MEDSKTDEIVSAIRKAATIHSKGDDKISVSSVGDAMDVGTDNKDAKVL